MSLYDATVMTRIFTFALIIFSLFGSRVHAADLILSADSAEGPSWSAKGIKLQIAPPSELSLDISSLALTGREAVRRFRLRCTQLMAGEGARCDNAPFSVTLPGWGRVQGRASMRLINQQHWQVHLQIPQRGLEMQVAQSGIAMSVSLVFRDQPAAELQTLAKAFGVNIPGEISGLVDLNATAVLAEAPRIHAQFKVKDLTYGEDSGRYATDKLSAEAEVHYDAANSHWQLALDARGGQAYLEPLFLDFSILPLQVKAVVDALKDGWNLQLLQAFAGNSGTVSIAGQLSKEFKPTELELSYEAQELLPLVTSFVQPFLIGGALEGLELQGRSLGSVSFRGGAVDRAAATLDGVSLKATKLGVALDQISGDIAWAAQNSQPSKLSWRGGTLQRVPVGASDITFRVQGREFELLAPWRQPLLKGALKVEKLVLRELGSAQLAAEFRGAVEPIDLAALCKALGWPEFGGTFGGQLPGLTVRDDVWTFDGALEAQAFDGSLHVENLRAIQPFGVLPRVMADMQIRRLDLEQLTGAFSFGRITGRLDGDVKGLRLLNWSPVAFDARLYTTPGDNSTQRISQRAIDNISAIGGGPTGVLSRGFLSFFKEFQYARLGLSCTLQDGVCLMGGVEPAPAGNGEQAGYYLVKGRLLPRIDVRGYATRVSWNNLIQQLNAARESSGPQLK